MSEPPRTSKVQADISADAEGFEREEENTTSISEPFDPSKFEFRLNEKLLIL